MIDYLPLDIIVTLLSITLTITLVREIISKRLSFPGCRQCGYTLFYPDQDRCPECGVEIKSMKCLTMKSRRPYRIALLIVLVTISTIMSAYLWLDRPWYEIAPSKLVLMLTPMEDFTNIPITSSISKEVWKRRHSWSGKSENGRYTRIHEYYLLQRILQNEQQQGRLITTRSKWPKGSTPCIQLLETDIISSYLHTEFEVSTSDGTILQKYHPNHLGDMFGGDPLQRIYYSDPTIEIPIGQISDGKLQTRFKLSEIKDNLKESSLNELSTVADFTTTSKFEWVESVKDAITPVDNPLITSQLNSKFMFDIIEMTTNREFPLYLYIALTDTKEINGMALGIRCEVIAGDEILGHARWWCNSKIIENGELEIVIPLETDRVTFITDIKQILDDITLRIVGDPEMALRDFEKTTYWEGEIFRYSKDFGWHGASIFR